MKQMAVLAFVCILALVRRLDIWDEPVIVGAGVCVCPGGFDWPARAWPRKQTSSKTTTTILPSPHSWAPD
jgi:hypothetical protein